MTEFAESYSFRQAYAMKQKVAETIQKNGGVYTMPNSDAGAIAECVSRCDGDYLEIGTLFGGSAIIAALFCKGHVYCIDPFGYAPGQTRSKATPSAELVLKNAAEFGAEHKITPFTQKHPPLPPELEDKTFDVIFIDGDHSYQGAKADWDNLHNKANRFILFHDVNGSFGCERAFQQAAQNPNWRVVFQAGKIGVLERKHLSS